MLAVRLPTPYPPSAPGRVTLPGPVKFAGSIFSTRGDPEVPERDDRSDDRQRPARPAWATVPTMSWSRVVPGSREEEDTGEQPTVRPRRTDPDDEQGGSTSA